MRQIDDAYPFLRMMTFECGFKAVGVPYRWQARKRGFSQNSLPRLFDQGLNGIITYTSAPVRAVLMGGFVIAGLAVLYAFLNLIIGLVLYRRVAEPGILTIIVSVFLPLEQEGDRLADLHVWRLVRDTRGQLFRS